MRTRCNIDSASTAIWTVSYYYNKRLHKFSEQRWAGEGKMRPQSLERPWLWTPLFWKTPWQTDYCLLPQDFTGLWKLNISHWLFSAMVESCLLLGQELTMSSDCLFCCSLPFSPGSQATFDFLLLTSFQSESHIWPGWQGGGEIFCSPKDAILLACTS